MDTTHCQICGREIKAKNGIIAHHGYKRPGGGGMCGAQAIVVPDSEGIADVQRVVHDRGY